MCSVCGSSNQAEFTAEIMLHFRGIKNLNKPGLMIFPTVSVCLNCGLSQFVAPKAELSLLEKATLVRVMASLPD